MLVTSPNSPRFPVAADVVRVNSEGDGTVAERTGREHFTQQRQTPPSVYNCTDCVDPT